ncbi:TAP-like protein-domain-containing protein [Hypoxylon trugodes]|uniref:TAP-like protein-domain-containing protein n=1 Tax=Hypoxylon trugodes TaxID=326681 RepID=UPI0021939758|nr:TAP-like protein-domain-containing protein [Hypoxylon trugodes]KAI1391969.1 TAP-like protein-domain-containing protein [Hypoxylon trugodes]
MKYSTVAGLVASLGHSATASDTSGFDWKNLKPSASLEYTPCYDEFKCAKLSVPLDWLNNSSSTNGTARANIAIIALPATVPETDPSFGGTIIMNPGGPGESGVEFVLGLGHTSQNIVDANKHYEILSFDPRGVGLSEPRADCFNNEYARNIYNLQSRAMGRLDISTDATRRVASLVGALAERCGEATGIQGYMSTASVARDMVEIVDQIEELRNKNATSTNAKKMRIRGSSEYPQSSDDVARIQYWGFSYGTILGNYFASMFPGRVGRMMLEGVVNVHDYLKGEWAKNLQDTDEELNAIWDGCYDAGSECPLYKPTDKSGGDIRSRVEKFLSDLQTSPAQIVDGTYVEEVTREDVLSRMFSSLYDPIYGWPSMAAGIAEGMEGNFTNLYSITTAEAYCSTTEPQSYTWKSDSLFGVNCGDAVDQTDMTISDFQAYVAELNTQSTKFSSIWSTKRLACRAWRYRPKYRFEGPFTSPAAAGSLSSPVAGKPAAPILFLSSKLDPVTPHKNAGAMAADHPGAGVLTQDSMGHGTIKTPSKCKNAYVSKYFETGELPPAGTVCESDCKVFQKCDAPTAKRDLSHIPEFSRRGYSPFGPFGISE